MIKNLNWVKRTLFLLSLLFLLIPGTAKAQRQNIYLLGYNGGYQSAVQAPPGVYMQELVLQYFNQGIKDQNGNRILNNLDLDFTFWGNNFSWVSPIHFLGANYGINLLIPFSNPTLDFGSVIGRQASNFGLSDMYFEPLSLGWHTPHVAVTFSYGAFFPTGRFTPGSPNNLGRGTWTHLLNLGATVFFDKEHTFSLTNYLRGEIHQGTRDTTLTLGPDLIWEWSLGKTFAHLLDVSAVGYGEWQVGDNHGGIPIFPTTHQRVYGVGGEIGVTIPQVRSRLALRGYGQFGGVLHTQGPGFYLTFSSGLWNYKPKK